MNKVEELRFLQSLIKICRDEEGGIEKICINDVCATLKRMLFLKDGTVIRKCPSVTIVYEDMPKELFADFGEVVEFVKWVAAGSKILEPTCRELLESLQKSRLVPVVGRLKPQPAPAPDAEPMPQPEELIVLEYAGNPFTMKMSDGRYMVNATEMARPFEKRPTVWLKLAETLKLRQTLVDDGAFDDIENQVIATRGPYGATWLEIHLWVQFAQWLSPAFASWCSKKLVSLLRGGSVDLANEPSADSQSARQPRYDDLSVADSSFLPVPASYEEALTVIEKQQDTIHRQKEFLKLNKHKFQHYEETVETRQWFSTTMIANELGISAIKLNLFLMDEDVQDKIREEWVIAPEYRHLRDIHIYEWFNHKTNYTNKYKIDSWTPQGREYIVELWKKKNA